MQHDLGGQDFGEIVVTDRPLSFWEFSIHALLVILAQKNPSLMTTDELRRSVEALEPNAYSTWGYYEKWSAAMTHILLERGVITQDELDAELLGNSCMIEPTLEPSFQVGDIVQVKSEDTRVRWRKPHLRCPGYVFNCVGVIEKYIGKFDDPFLLAFRGHGPQQHLYCVSFYLRDIWPEGCNQSSNDKVTLDVYEGWLMSASPQTKPVESASPINSAADLDTYDHHSFDHHHGHDHDHDHQHGHHDDQTHPHDHSHDHDHGHLHETRVEIECKSIEKEGEETPGKLVGEAVLRTLFKKGIVTEQQVRDVVMKLEGLSSRLAGADLVVKAWMDPEYKARLLENGTMLSSFPPLTPLFLSLSFLYQLPSPQLRLKSPLPMPMLQLFSVSSNALLKFITSVSVLFAVVIPQDSLAYLPHGASPPLFHSLLLILLHPDAGIAAEAIALEQFVSRGRCWNLLVLVFRRKWRSKFMIPPLIAASLSSLFALRERRIGQQSSCVLLSLEILWLG
jgi:hypothetical protein